MMLLAWVERRRSFVACRLTICALAFFHLHDSIAAQGRDNTSIRPKRRISAATGVQSAEIHWQDVPLEDAVDRLRQLFHEQVFVDRRLDPSTRVTVQLSASDASEALSQIASVHDWGVARIGEVVYLGPKHAASALPHVDRARRHDIANLAAARHGALSRKRRVEWVRLSEPRELVTALVESVGWKLDGAERIPHDAWAAGHLDGLALGQQLTLILLGFDLTYSLRPDSRVVEVVPLDRSSLQEEFGTDPSATEQTQPVASPKETKQVYTLRVVDQPVGAVMREVGRKLNHTVEFDEKAIRDAGLTLDARVSFAVENVDQDALFNAVLRPAELTMKREGNRILVTPIQTTKE